MPSLSPTADPGLLRLAQQFLAHQVEPPPPELQSAWNDFYQIYTQKIRAYAHTCGATDDNIGDCVQEVWAELIARLPNFRLDSARGTFDIWLFPIVRNKTVDQLRRQKKTRLTHLHEELLNSAVDNRPSPCQSAEQAEIVSVAWKQLKQKLHGRNFEVLKMRLLDQAPVEEVATKLGISTEQVWYRYHRARKELSKIGAACSQGRLVNGLNGSVNEEHKNSEKSAQGKSNHSVSPNVDSSFHERDGGNGVDYVFQRVELGRRELSPEWKVKWNCGATPKPVLYLRKTAIVAYAEICAAEEIIATYWPRIVNAAITAGVAAGIATIIATPTAALPVFQGEFYKQLGQRGNGEVEKKTYAALSAKVEASGPWCGVEGERRRSKTSQWITLI